MWPTANPQNKFWKIVYVQEIILNRYFKGEEHMKGLAYTQSTK